VLAWTAPQTDADGRVLTDLTGYRIYYGTQRGNYSQSVAIGNPSSRSYTISNLSAGIYYMVVTSLDASDNESVPSAEISKIVQ
jgi:hypothetical protein